MVRAFFAGPAELHRTEGMIGIGLKREVREDLAKADPGAISFSNEKPHSASLSETGGHGQWDAQGGIVPARDRPVTQSPDKGGQKVGDKGHFRVSQTSRSASHTRWGGADGIVVHGNGHDNGS